MSNYLATKVAAAKRYLGARWVLSPENRVTRLPVPVRDETRSHVLRHVAEKAIRDGRL